MGMVRIACGGREVVRVGLHHTFEPLDGTGLTLCADNIYHIPIPNRAKSSAELLERYRSFKSVSAQLPIIENLLYPDPRISDILQRIPSTFYNPPCSLVTTDVPSSPSEIAAFAFAVFGWSGVNESNIALA